MSGRGVVGRGNSVLLQVKLLRMAPEVQGEGTSTLNVCSISASKEVA